MESSTKRDFFLAYLDDLYCSYRFSDKSKAGTTLSDLQGSPIFTWNPDIEATGEVKVPYINTRPFWTHWGPRTNKDWPATYQYLDTAAALYFMKQEVTGDNKTKPKTIYASLMCGAAEDWRCGFLIGCPWLLERKVATK